MCRERQRAIGGSHLCRRGAPEMVACGDGALKRKHVEYIGADGGGERPQFIKAQFGQVAPLAHAKADRLADDLVGIAEGDAASYQVIR